MGEELLHQLQQQVVWHLRTADTDSAGVGTMMPQHSGASADPEGSEATSAQRLWQLQGNEREKLQLSPVMDFTEAVTPQLSQVMSFTEVVTPQLSRVMDFTEETPKLQLKDT